MKKNSPTEVGPNASRQTYSDDHIDAINQVFALLELNYHNQFFKAYQTQTNLNTIKRLWLETLGSYSPETMMRATKHIIETSEFLPTLHRMIQSCEKYGDSNIPDVHTAYVEACRAPSPKKLFKWSHLAVYHAGKACDWYFLQSSPESVAYPVFKIKYEEIKARVMQGEILTSPIERQITDHVDQPISKQENGERLAQLRSKLDL